jgi:hypothetical protein
MLNVPKQLLVALAAVAFGSVLAAQGDDRQVSERAALDFRCVPPERLDYGCSLKIVTLSCSDSHLSGWEAHFFSELHRGAPLWVNLGGRQLSLRSNLPVDDSFLHGPGDSWREDYEGENLKARIDYRPAKPTCPAEKADDGCEYFDVAADVLVEVAGAGSRAYSGSRLVRLLM